MKLAPSKISIVSFVTSLAMLSLSSWTIANADGGYAVVDADGRVCGVIVATSADPFGNGGFMPIEYMGCPAGSRIIFQTNRSPDGNVAGYGAGGGTTYNEETKIFTVSSTSPDGSSKTEIAIKDGVATSASTGESFDTGSGVEVETALSPVELVKLVLQGGGLSEKDLSRLSDKSTNDILAQNIVDLVNKGGTVSSTKLDLLNGENKDLILVKVTQSIVNSLKNGDAVNRTNLEILSEVHLDSVLTESREQVSRETASLSSDAARKAGELSKKTPGIQRCVSWSGFGTSGKECATYNPGTSETLTVTSFKASSETSTATTAGSASSETSTATTAGSASSETSTATTAGSASSETSTVSSDTKGKDETLNQINKVLDTLKGSSATSTDVIVVKSTPSEVKTILKEVVPTANEISAITNGISKFDSIRSQTYSSQHSLPSLRNVEESYTSLTPNVCAIEGNTAVSKSGGICSIEITVKDSLGNSFKTVKEVNFRKLSSSKKP
jgi:hypothetical protein